MLWLLLLLLLGFLGLQQVAYSTMAGSAVMRMRAAAAVLGNERIDHIRSLDSTAADSIEGEEPYGAIPGQPEYRRVTSVAPDSRASDVNVVTVRVYWDGDRCSLRTDALLASVRR